MIYEFILLFSGSDGRLVEGEGGLGGLYAGHQTARPESASSASPPSMNHAHFPGFPPPTSGGMLVVPQPINASKVSRSRTTSNFCPSRPVSDEYFWLVQTFVVNKLKLWYHLTMYSCFNNQTYVTNPVKIWHSLLHVSVSKRNILPILFVWKQFLTIKNIDNWSLFWNANIKQIEFPHHQNWAIMTRFFIIYIYDRNFCVDLYWTQAN